MRPSLAEKNIYVKPNVYAPVVIREMAPADWEAVSNIYAEGIATGEAPFETLVTDENSKGRNGS